MNRMITRNTNPRNTAMISISDFSKVNRVKLMHIRAYNDVFDSNSVKLKSLALK